MSSVPAETAAQAEAAFYAAFENGDLEAMADIWSQSDDIVCIHPRGPQLRGRDEVMQSWQDILVHAGGFRVSVQLLHDYSDQDTSVRFVNETLFNENDPSQPITVLATNAYRRTDSGWRIVLHHASPAPGTVEETDEARIREPGTGVTLH